MDYDAILKKMNLYYFEGKLQNSVPPPEPKLTREEYIQMRNNQLYEKRRIQYEQFQKRKLLTNIGTTGKVQMNILKLG